jgi:hypothetical protein
VTDEPTLGLFDPSHPHVARVWDYQLGGKDNFAADRAAAHEINAICRRVGAPDGSVVARENRDLLGRAVRFLVGEAGIRQFIDIGAGLPTQANVHEVAHQLDPGARVVYVDVDPMVLVHGRALLAIKQTTTVIQADARQPEAIIGHPDLRALIDFDEPVAVLFVAILHLLPAEADPTGIVACFRDAMAAGSYLVITHATNDARPELAAKVATEFRRRMLGTPLVPRCRAEIAQFFDGFELLAPGLVFPNRWRPTSLGDNNDGAQWMYAGVGRKATS